MVADHRPAVIWAAVVGALASWQLGSWQRRPAVAPVAHEPYCSCDAELRQILDCRDQLDSLRSLVVILSVTSGSLLCAVVALLSCSAGCCLRAPAGRFGAVTASSPTAGTRGDPVLLALLAKQEVRR